MARHVDRADAGKKAAPILDQNKREERDQQRKSGLRNLGANNRRSEIEDALHQIFDDGLTARRDELRAFDREANRNDQHHGDNPARNHAIRHWQRAEMKYRFGRRGHALRFGGKRGRTGDDG